MSSTFQFINEQLIGGIKSATTGLMAQYSGWMMALAASSATIYIMWRGYQTLAGKLSTPVEDVAWDLVRMAIILSFVANTNGYLDGVIDAINGIKDGFTGGKSIWAELDTLWKTTQTLGKTLHDLDNSYFVQDQGAIAMILVWFGSLILMIVTAFVAMIAELMILLLGITAPIFIFCLMYGFLRPMFNNWLQNIFSAILTILLASLSLQLVMNFMNKILDQSSKGAIEANIVTIGFQVLLAGFSAALLILVSSKLAGALAGAATTATMQGLARAGIGNTVQAAGNTAQAAGKAAAAAGKFAGKLFKGRGGGGAGTDGAAKPPSSMAAARRKAAIDQQIARNLLRENRPPSLPPPKKPLALPPPK